jgi:hypothetical protein
MIALLLTAFLAAAPSVKYCSVPCHPKKIAKKSFHAVIVKEQGTCCQAPVNVNVVIQQAQEQHQEQHQALVAPRSSSLVVGLRGAAGASFCLPQGYLGLLGLRLHSYPWHLGAEVYTEFYWGYGAQLLFYPVQTHVINWHLNGGAYWFDHIPYVVARQPRQVDLTLGTGLEVEVLPHLYLTGDLRARIPSPIAMAAVGDVANTIGTSLIQTQLLLGVMVVGP